jgi:hypothetical protein
MAHIAKLGALTDELISLIASSSTKVNMFHSVPQCHPKLLVCDLAAIFLELIGDSLILQNSTCTGKVHFGLYDRRTTLERISSMSQAVSMVWRRNFESTMKIHWQMPFENA